MFKVLFCVLLRVYGLVFIAVLMYNPLWKIDMDLHAVCKRGVNCFIKFLVKKIVKITTLARGAARGARARGGDEATAFTKVEPLRRAPSP